VFIVFSNGLRVDSIKLDTVEIYGLNIRISDKLDLRIKRLKLKPSNESSDPKELLNTIKTAFFLSYFLNSLAIEELIFKQEILRVDLIKNRLLISHEKGSIRADIGWSEPSIKLDFKEIEYQDLDIQGNAEVTFNILNSSFNGVFNLLDIEGSFKGKIGEKLISLAIINAYTNSLNRVGALIPISD
jgi:hypothetical protein